MASRGLGGVDFNSRSLEVEAKLDLEEGGGHVHSRRVDGVNLNNWCQKVNAKLETEP